MNGRAHIPAAALLRAAPEVVMVLCALAVPLGGWELAAAYGAWPLPYSPGDVLVGALFAEAAVALFMGTVVDVASRLRRPPPWWATPLIAFGILLVYPEQLQFLLDALAQGWWVVLPVLATLSGRLADLWTLPAQAPLDKQRRRALVFGRAYTILVIACAFVGPFLAEAALVAATGWRQGEGYLMPTLLPLYAVVFYAICAWDAVRVQRPAFAKRPRNLWPRFDQGESARLDPLV